ncbi:2'-5' RNA ligase family protein [Streptomyces sp. DT20]|uniref:2'-5' RNA ligase family protein n=1 Tax=Streptomyces sp. DT20 TaxID=3416519 RepID=UPI003CF77266
MLGYTGAAIVDAACVRVALDRNTVGADGISTDPELRRQVAAALDALLDAAGPASVPRLAALAAVRRPVRLALGDGGNFDDRVLWSRIDGALDALHALAADVRAVVRSCGVALEDRPLRPRLTLARGRRGDLSSVAEIAAVFAGFTGLPWPAERLHLVGGTTGGGPGPVRYRDIEAWPFDGGDRT